MADPAAVHRNNPLFVGVPNVVFRMYENPIKMARSKKKLYKWIKEQLAAQVAAEGGQQFFVVEFEGKQYSFQFTAQGGFFTVLVKPPAGREPMVQDGLFVFSFKDLYLLGVLRDIWRFYDDACLIGSPAEDANNVAYWGRLGFNGGYCEGMCDSLVGMEPMYYALRTISDSNSNGLAVRMALFQFIVAIPEPVRFPPWLRYELYLLRSYGAEPPNNAILKMSSCFSDWSSVCKRIRRGPDAFIPGDGFNTYKDLLMSAFLLLSSPPEEEL